MPNREKVVKEYEDYVNSYIPVTTYGDYVLEMHKAVLALLKEREEWEKALCKEICDFIRHGLNAIKADQKDYICHVIQELFIHFDKNAHIKGSDWFCADGERRPAP